MTCTIRVPRLPRQFRHPLLGPCGRQHRGFHQDTYRGAEADSNSSGTLSCRKPIIIPGIRSLVLPLVQAMVPPPPLASVQEVQGMLGLLESDTAPDDVHFVCIGRSCSGETIATYN
jgi:hypothetical protein